MFTIETVSGATYTVRNGRLTRVGKVHAYMPPDMQPGVFAARPFVNLTVPTVGEPWSYRLTTGEVFTTGPIVRITPATRPVRVAA